MRAKTAKVDEQVVVQCPLQCPRCDGPVRLTGEVASQQQVDIPKTSFTTTQFEIELGVCTNCGLRVQGRHPKQTSDAVGVGSVQIGPTVLATTAELNKVGGLSYGKVATFLSRTFGLNVNRSTLARGLERLSVKAEPTYEAIAERIRASPEVYPDETGWRIGGRSAWLWVATNKRQTLYEMSGGGNRTDTGARTQSVLMTLPRTGHQIGLAVADALVELLRSPRPAVIPAFLR